MMALGLCSFPVMIYCLACRTVGEEVIKPGDTEKMVLKKLK
jgi:hypothetical protein